MAHATPRIDRIAHKVTRTIVDTVYEDKPDGALVALSDDEARFLSCVLACIGGSPDNTARRHADTIREALYEAGYCYRNEGLLKSSPYHGASPYHGGGLFEQGSSLFCLRNLEPRS